MAYELSNPLLFVEGKDLNDYFVGGTFYVGGCTNLPKGQSAGVLKVDVAVDTVNELQVVLARQTFTGLKDYGDKMLTEYERFVFPKEVQIGFDAGSGWVEVRRTLTFTEQI